MRCRGYVLCREGEVTRRAERDLERKKGEKKPQEGSRREPETQEEEEG
jgi:hypothetical protein